MAEAQVPYSWVGRQVEAAIVEWGHSHNGTTLPLHGENYTGTLELVNDLGIVDTLLDPEDGEETPSTFYPWSSVISLRPTD